jgi:hypothetical protein
VGVPVSDVLLFLTAHLFGAGTALWRHLLSSLLEVVDPSARPPDEAARG